MDSDILELAAKIRVKTHMRTGKSGKTSVVRSYMRSPLKVMADMIKSAGGPGGGEITQQGMRAQVLKESGRAPTRVEMDRGMKMARKAGLKVGNGPARPQPSAASQRPQGKAGKPEKKKFDKAAIDTKDLRFKEKDATPKDGEGTTADAFDTTKSKVPELRKQDKPKLPLGQKVGGGDPNPPKDKGKGKGTPQDPVKVYGDLEMAVQLLSEGKSIRLETQKEVSLLADRVNEMVQDIKARGLEAPDYDFCKISVPGTNLFCQENKGIPRIRMPQFKGNDSEGKKIDAEQSWQEMLDGSGIPTERKSVPVTQLKATQNQLVGAKVAGMAATLRQAEKTPEKKNPTTGNTYGADAAKIREPIYTTSDGYIVDGHHRWAAVLVVDGDDDISGDEPMAVKEIGMEIGATIDLANEFTAAAGIVPQSGGGPKPGEAVAEMKELDDAPTGTSITHRVSGRYVKQEDGTWQAEKGTKSVASDTFTKSVADGKVSVTGDTTAPTAPTAPTATTATTATTAPTATTANPDLPQTPLTGPKPIRGQAALDAVPVNGRVSHPVTGDYVRLADGMWQNVRGGAPLSAADLAKEGSLSRNTDAYGHGVEHPYYDYDRVADGRVILKPNELADFDQNGPHSIEKYLETVEENGKAVTVLSKEREALHVDLLKKSMEGIRPNPEGKTSFFLGGGYGAGKGTATRMVPGYPPIRELKEYETKDPGTAVIIDPDGIKESLPEWGYDGTGKKNLGATGGFTHEESSLVSKRLYDASRRTDLDFVLDGTGDNSVKSIGGKVKKAKDAGYSTTSIYVTVPAEEAIIRTVTRAMGNGRFILPTLTTGIHSNVSRILEPVGQLYADHNLYDSDVPLGTPPKPIIRGGEVVDQEKYESFLAKAEDTTERALTRALDLAERRGFDSVTMLDGTEMSPERVRDYVLQYLRDSQEVIAAQAALNMQAG